MLSSGIINMGFGRDEPRRARVRWRGGRTTPALERLREIAPELAGRTVIMSGGSRRQRASGGLENLGAGRFLLKPFSAKLLHETLVVTLAG